jgi:hypothetical protein
MSGLMDGFLLLTFPVKVQPGLTAIVEREIRASSISGVGGLSGNRATILVGSEWLEIEESASVVKARMLSAAEKASPRVVQSIIATVVDEGWFEKAPTGEPEAT